MGWSDLILQHQGFDESIVFESYRDELLQPQEISLMWAQIFQLRTLNEQSERSLNY